MNLLLDTHLLLWTALRTRRVPDQARLLIDDPENQLFFSVVNIWEIAIERGLGRDDFSVKPALLRRGLLDNDFREPTIVSDHAIASGLLPLIHRDPFDRLPIAQAAVEGMTLLTADPIVARYPGPIRAV